MFSYTSVLRIYFNLKLKQIQVSRFTIVLPNSPVAIHLQGCKGMDEGWKCSKRVKPQYRGNNIM